MALPTQVALGEGTLSLRCLLLDCDYLNAQLVRRNDMASAMIRQYPHMC